MSWINRIYVEYTRSCRCNATNGISRLVAFFALPSIYINHNVAVIWSGCERAAWPQLQSRQITMTSIRRGLKSKTRMQSNWISDTMASLMLPAQTLQTVYIKLRNWWLRSTLSINFPFSLSWSETQLDCSDALLDCPKILPANENYRNYLSRFIVSKSSTKLWQPSVCVLVMS